MNSYNVYEKLYADTKAAFTIVKNDKQYSLGEYMRMKAGAKAASAEKKHNAGVEIASNSFSNIKSKFSSKASKTKTMKKFPLRTAASALLSAVIVCSLVLSFGSFSGKNIHSEAPTIVEPDVNEVHEETSFILNEK
jgi:hypothetical protein